MCWIKLTSCLSFFQCKLSTVSYRIVNYDDDYNDDDDDDDRRNCVTVSACPVVRWLAVKTRRGWNDEWDGRRRSRDRQDLSIHGYDYIHDYKHASIIFTVLIPTSYIVDVKIEVFDISRYCFFFVTCDQWDFLLATYRADVYKVLSNF